jgi:putative ABC transport system permease protein
LVVFQFTISVMLIVAVLVVYQQIQFIQSTTPGYNKENVIRFTSEGKLQGNEDAFAAELKTLPGVLNASFTQHNIVGRNYATSGFSWDGDPTDRNVYFEGFFGGYNFVETMGMQMVAGRSFSKSFAADGSNIILNEAAVKAMHLKDPVGKTIKGGNNLIKIIGVVKDFHFESLHEAVKPAFIALAGGTSPWYKMMIRIKGDHQKETIAQIQKLYEAYNPGFPFNYSFLDEAYQKQYETEVRVSMLSEYFSVLAIIISCLGLFGLVAFTAQKRQKEIGIRKVVGASVNSITFMLTKDFLRLVFIAVLIAFPLSWYLMNQWLHGFAYRINIGPVVFVIAITSVILITILTVSFQAIKAALVNPVRSLRSE